MGLVDKIKKDAAKSGQNKGKFIYVREGTKTRVRFLQDMEDGFEVEFHDSFERGVNVPCQEAFGRSCEYCDDSDLRTRSQYIWSVYDYEAKEVRLFMFPVNNCSPVPALIAMFDNYGTLLDRDFVVSVQGKQQNKTYSVVPMDKVKFRNDKAKPFSKAQVLKMIDKAWPATAGDDDDEEEDEYKQKTKSKPTSSGKHKPAKQEEADDESDWDDEVEDDTPDYTEMSARELYALCKERGLSVPPKKPEKFYVKQLEDDDAASDDWDDSEDEE